MSGRFAARPTRQAGVSVINGWRLKRYEITLDGTPIGSDVKDAVDGVLTATLEPTRDGLGFVIIHRGAEQVWLLVDTWHTDIVHQHTFSANRDRPAEFTAVPAGGPTACVWELAVHAHERAAYIAHILNPPGGPDPEGYLSDAAPCEHTRRRLLEDFSDAWSRGDVDALMELMSGDPTYRASIGDGPGTDYIGRQAVRHGFTDVIAAEGSADQPPPPPSDGICIAGDLGLSPWSYATVGPDGTTRTVKGIDVWTFDGDRIAIKDAYRKAFPDPVRNG